MAARATDGRRFRRGARRAFSSGLGTVGTAWRLMPPTVTPEEYHEKPFTTLYTSTTSPDY